MRVSRAGVAPRPRASGEAGPWAPGGIGRRFIRGSLRSVGPPRGSRFAVTGLPLCLSGINFLSVPNASPPPWSAFLSSLRWPLFLLLLSLVRPLGTCAASGATPGYRGVSHLSAVATFLLGPAWPRALCVATAGGPGVAELALAGASGAVRPLGPRSGRVLGQEPWGRSGAGLARS